LSGLLLLLLFRSHILKLEVDLLLSCGLLNFLDTLVKRDCLRGEDLRGGGHHHDWSSLDEDVTPDLLAEAVVVSVHESEERDVVACDLRGLHLNRHVDLLTGSN